MQANGVTGCLTDSRKVGKAFKTLQVALHVTWGKLKTPEPVQLWNLHGEKQNYISLKGRLHIARELLQQKQECGDVAEGVL